MEKLANIVSQKAVKQTVNNNKNKTSVKRGGSKYK